jgi:hypothetical protein
MPSLFDLLRVPSKDEILDKFIALLRAQDFPVATWHSGSFEKHTVESESSILVDLYELVPIIAAGGYIKLAGAVADEWVDLIGENAFDEDRKPAIYTRGTVSVIDSAGIGPTTISPGSFWIANDDKSIRFKNITGGTVPLNGSLPLTFEAESAGTKWNVGVGALTEILTPQPGLTIANPPLSSGTWITQQGADKESNTAYAQRCIDKWSTLGSGSDEGAYRYHATSSSSEITRVRAYSPGGGSVRVIVGGDAGPVSSTALTAAATRIEEKRPLGVPDVLTQNILVFIQPISGTLFVAAGKDPVAAKSLALQKVDALQRATPIGGRVSREKIIAALSVDAVEDIELALPAADFQLGASEIWVPSYQIIAQ